MAEQRGLSKKFMNDLVTGNLHSLLSRVRLDTSLDLQIRGNSLNVYYRGGSLVRVDAPTKRNPEAYKFTFNPDYAKDRKPPLVLPPPLVANAKTCERWVKMVPELKDTMDLWFGKHPKDERALQQLVVWENNDSPWAKGTDYFIVDIEYDSRKGNSKKGEGGRFDLIALKWESTPASRSMRGKTKPKLTIIEMKAGDGALKGKAGLHDHVRVLERFSSSPTRKAEFAREMIAAFRQKQQLGLIRALPIRGSKSYPRPMPRLSEVDSELDFMILLVGHDPASRKLAAELESLKTRLPIQICTANFMGFGLHKEGVCSLAQFLERFQLQVGSKPHLK